MRNLGRAAAAALLIPALAAAQGVRPAVFASQFYPDDPARLAADIDGFLKAAAPAAVPSARVIGIIAPHAGYVYSGRTAGAAYALVRGLPYDTVVIVAPSHRVGFEGVSVWPDGGFETPLGVAKVDSALGIEGSPYAIGLFGYAYYQENQDKLKAISIEGVAPTAESAEDNSYPLSRPLFIYSDAAVMQAKPQVADFINFYLTRVNEVIADVGYFPASTDALQAAMQAWLDAMK